MSRDRNKVISSIRYLIIGITILNFAILTNKMSADFRLLSPAEGIEFVMTFSLQNLILIALSYAPPNASGRQTFLLYGGGLFLLINIPVLIYLLLVYDFYLHAVLVVFQWVVALIFIIVFGMYALFNGIRFLINRIK